MQWILVQKGDRFILILSREGVLKTVKEMEVCYMWISWFIHILEIIFDSFWCFLRYASRLLTINMALFDYENTPKFAMLLRNIRSSRLCDSARREKEFLFKDYNRKRALFKKYIYIIRKMRAPIIFFCVLTNRHFPYVLPNVHLLIDILCCVF